jgi:hypothetical protein
MKINLIFDQPNAPASFKNAVQKAASMLDAAITNDITVNIEVGYGTFPLGGTVTGGEAEAEPNLDIATSASYSVVSSALSAGAAPGDPNFKALPDGATVSGYNGGFTHPSTEPYSQVVVWSAEAKALGFISADQPDIDGFAGFATDIPADALVGVALHELTHAMGRVPNGLPADADNPDIFDLFRFKTNNPGQGERLVVDNGTSAPAAYFSVTGPVNSGGTDLAHYGQTSDPSDFLNPPDSNLTPNDSFNELYDNQTFQRLTAVDLTQMDVLGFGAFAVVWGSGASGDFGDAANWSSHVVPNSGTNVEISSSGTYTVSSTQSVTINTLVMAAGVTLDVISGIFTIDNVLRRESVVFERQRVSIH